MLGNASRQLNPGTTRVFGDGFRLITIQMPEQAVLTQTLTDWQESALVSGAIVTRPNFLKFSSPLSKMR